MPPPSSPTSSPLPAWTLANHPRPASDAQERTRRHDVLQPWTAARCHRLLRQLQSRLESLRKLRDDCTAQSRESGRYEEHDGEERLHKPPKRARQTYGTKRRAESSIPSSNLPATTPPRTMRTLGAMKIAHSSPLAGQVDFATPTWRKIRGQQLSSPTTSRPLDTHSRSVSTAVPPELQQERRSLRKYLPPERARLHEAIFDWLATLLRSTAPGAQPQPEPHKKSLLGMCLRKVPGCINEIAEYEQRLSKEKGEESIWQSSNASFEMYGQLEAFGPSGRGWQPLKLLVRAHAISILSDAITDRLLDPVAVTLFVRLCTHLGCEEEASRLVSSTLDTLPAPSGSRSTFKADRHLQSLHIITSREPWARMSGFNFDCITTLLASERLPQTWLTVRAFSSIWASSLESMASKLTVPSVFNFIITAMSRLACEVDAASKTSAEQTLVSFLGGAVAASMSLESSNTTAEPKWKKRAWRRFLRVLDDCHNSVRNHVRRPRSLGNAVLLFAFAKHLAAKDSHYADDTLREQVRNEVQRLFHTGRPDLLQFQCHQMALLIASIARCRSRASGCSGNDALADLCDKLDTLRLPKQARRGLKTEAAFLLAQKTRDLRDLAFAERLPATNSLPTSGTMLSGWHWDEGISEWVLLDQQANAGQKRKRTAEFHQRKPASQVAALASSDGRQKSGSAPQSNPKAKCVVKLTELADLINRRKTQTEDGLPKKILPRSTGSENLRRVSFRDVSMIPSDDGWDELTM